MRAGRGWLIVATLALLAFVLLATVVSSTSWASPLDELIRRAVLDVRNPGSTNAMWALTTLGSAPVVVGTALTGVVILRVRTGAWSSSLTLVVAVAISAAATALLKIAVDRPRPPASERLGAAALDQAFPSGHTGDGSTALWSTAALVALTLPSSTARTLVTSAIGALGVGIGLSRVYLGYHWPTDVLGGWLVAVVASALSVAAVRGRLTRSGEAIGRDHGAPVARAAPQEQGR